MQKLRIISSQLCRNSCFSPIWPSTQTRSASIQSHVSSWSLEFVQVTSVTVGLTASLILNPIWTRPIQCETAQSLGPSSDSDDDVPDLSSLPSVSHGLFTYLCWSLFIGVWISALIAPVFVCMALLKGWWDALLTFSVFWLAGSLITLPHVPRFAEIVTSGVESWFARFLIHHEHHVTTSNLTQSPKKQTIYCYHPHGLFSIGAGLLAANLVRRGERVALVTSSHMRWFNPVLKWLLDLAGIDIIGASPSEVKQAMSKGDRSLILVIGGYEEAVLTKDGTDNIYINNRLGFIKYAIRYNYTLTPVYAFGENDLYECWDVAKSVRNFLATWKIPIVFFRGNKWLPLLPIRTDEGMKIVVGEPMHVAHNEEPSREQLMDHHQRYVNTLVALYNRNNDDRKRHLEIH